MYVIILNFMIFYIAHSLDSKSWDPECIDKWPTCDINGEFVINTICQYENCDPRTKGCLELPPDPEFRQMVLDQHNEIRNKIASGEETRSGVVSAADMMALSYDLDLEYTAICHVHGCIMDHDRCRGTKRFPRSGQNLAQRHGASDVPIKQHQIDEIVTLEGFRTLVLGWYTTEIEKDNFKDVIDNFTRFNHETGHLTALMWAETSHVGCAKALDRPNEKEFTMHITCNYHPPGNYEFKRMYTKGTPCSKCPSGTSCNSKYTSLCGKIGDKDVHFGRNPYRELDLLRGITNIPKPHSNTSIFVWCKHVFIISFVFLLIL